MRQARAVSERARRLMAARRTRGRQRLQKLASEFGFASSAAQPHHNRPILHPHQDGNSKVDRAGDDDAGHAVASDYNDDGADHLAETNMSDGIDCDDEDESMSSSDFDDASDDGDQIVDFDIDAVIELKAYDFADFANDVVVASPIMPVTTGGATFDSDDGGDDDDVDDDGHGHANDEPTIRRSSATMESPAPLARTMSPVSPTPAAISASDSSLWKASSSQPRPSQAATHAVKYLLVDLPGTKGLVSSSQHHTASYLDSVPHGGRVSFEQFLTALRQSVRRQHGEQSHSARTRRCPPHIGWGLHYDLIPQQLWAPGEVDGRVLCRQSYDATAAGAASSSSCSRVDRISGWRRRVRRAETTAIGNCFAAEYIHCVHRGRDRGQVIVAGIAVAVTEANTFYLRFPRPLPLEPPFDDCALSDHLANYVSTNARLPHSGGGGGDAAHHDVGRSSRSADLTLSLIHI